MKEKQLDFSKPLISVRRPSTILPSESEKKTRPDNSPPEVPPLPLYRSDLKSGPVRNPGTVPFHWECTPGRPKNETKYEQQSPVKPANAPKLPPGRTLNLKQQEESKDYETYGGLLSSPQKCSSSSTSEVKHESHMVEDSRSSEPKYDEDDDDDDDYVDASDALSRSESSLLNCSVSDVSGLDSPDMNSSGTFWCDPQTRDYMMARFLPAAKAMASETPPHTMKMQNVANEQPILIKKPATKEKRCTVECNPNTLPYVQELQEKRCEESEKEDECGKPGRKMHGVSGLLPYVCLKSSFGLLSPVPEVRMQAQKAVSVRQRRSNDLLSGPYRASEHEQTRGAHFEQRSTRGCQAMKTHEGNQSANGTKPLQHMALQGNESCSSIVHDGKEKVDCVGMSNGNSLAKSDKNFGELLASEDSNRKSSSRTPVAEKTMYVDTVHPVKSLRTSEVTDHGGVQPNDHPKLEVNRLPDDTTKDEKAVNSSHESSPDIKDCRDDGSRNLEIAENKGVNLENEGLKKLQIQELAQEQDQMVVPLARNSEKRNSETEAQKKKSITERCDGNRRSLLAPPPLPQAPSDSWLKRTLHTVSAKNTSSWSSMGLKKNGFAAPKWETMVKTSNVQPGHLRFSAEKLDAIPETL